MNPILRNSLLVASLLAALPLAAAPQVSEVWSRPTAGDAGTAAGFLRLRNPGPDDDRLLGASSERAASIELHQLVEHDGVAGMRPLPEGLAIPAGGELRLAPSGVHLMLFGLRAPLRLGERVPLILHFERAGAVPVALHVEAAAPETPEPAATGTGGHGHH